MQEVYIGLELFQHSIKAEALQSWLYLIWKDDIGATCFNFVRGLGAQF